MVKKSILIRILTILLILLVGNIFPTTVMTETTEEQEVAPYINIHPNNKEGLNRLLKRKRQHLEDMPIKASMTAEKYLDSLYETLRKLQNSTPPEELEKIDYVTEEELEEALKTGMLCITEYMRNHLIKFIIKSLKEGEDETIKALRIFEGHFGKLSTNVINYYRTGVEAFGNSSFNLSIYCFLRYIEKVEPKSAHAYFLLGMSYLQLHRCSLASNYLYKGGLLSLEQNEQDLALRAYESLRIIGAAPRSIITEAERIDANLMAETLFKKLHSEFQPDSKK